MPALDGPDESPLDAKTGFPLAVVTCTDCGFTYLVNLITLGVATDLNIPVPPQWIIHRQSLMKVYARESQ